MSGPVYEKYSTGKLLHRKIAARAVPEKNLRLIPPDNLIKSLMATIQREQPMEVARLRYREKREILEREDE